jgi:hypothetical protein
MSSNLPNWPGASEVYSRAYKVLENMAGRGHVTILGKNTRLVSESMRLLIAALKDGDEEVIKGLLLQTHIYN